MIHLPSTRARRAATLAVALCLLTGLESRAQQASPAPQLAELLPATTAVLVSAPDLGAARQALEATDIGKIAGQFGPFVNGIAAGLRAQIAQVEQQFERGSGLKVDDVLAALGGGFEIAIPVLDPRRGPPLPVALIRTAGREAAIRAMIAQLKARPATAGSPPLPASYTRGQVAVDAVPLPDGPPIFAAFTRDALLLAASPELENALLDAASGAEKSVAPLSSAPDFMAVRGRTVGGGLPVAFAYVNAGVLIQQAAAGDPEMPKTLQKLGVADIRAVGVALSVEGGKAILSGCLASPASGPRGGIFSIFAQGPVDAAALASLAPSDAMAFISVHFDFGQAMDAALALVDSMDAAQGKSLRGQIADVSKHLGLDLRKDLLGSLGGDWGLVGFAPPGGGLAESVLVVNAPDEHALGKAVRQLADAFQLEQRQIDYQGKEILYLMQAVTQPGRAPRTSLSSNPFAQTGGFSSLAVLISGGHAYVAGLPQQIEDYLDTMSVHSATSSPSSAGTGRLSADPAFAAALAAAPKGTSAFGWDNPGSSVTGMWNSIVQIAGAFQGLARGNGVPLDVGLLPRGADLAPFVRSGATMLVVDDLGVTFRSQASLGISGGAMLGVGAVSIAAAVAIPNLIEARKGSNEASAIGGLRILNTAQALYREGDKDQNGILDYAPDLASLQRCGNLIDPVLASGMKQGYRYEILQADQFTWSATAIPLTAGKSGDRSFFIDESGVIRYTMGDETPTKDSTPIGSSSSTRSPRATGGAPSSAIGTDLQYRTLYAGSIADAQKNMVPYLKKIGLLDASGAPKDADAYKRWMEGYVEFIKKNGQALGQELGTDKAKAQEFFDKNQ